MRKIGNSAHKGWNRHLFNNFMTKKEKSYISGIFKRKIVRINKIYNYEQFFDRRLPCEDMPPVKEFSVEVGNKNILSGIRGHNEQLDSKMKDLMISDVSTDRISEIGSDKESPLRMKDEFNFNTENDLKHGSEKNLNQDQIDKKLRKTKKICFIKSIKLPRLMTESNITIVDDIAVKLKIEELIDEFICKKYKIRDFRLMECFLANEHKIHEFFKVQKFRTLLCDIFKTDDIDLKNIFLLALLKKSQLIVDYGNISEFFDHLVSYMPILPIEEIEKTDFSNNFMFNLPGVLLATLLLINQEDLTHVFFLTLKTRIEYLFDIQLKYVWRFLAILIINLSDNDKIWLITTIRDKIIRVVSSQNVKQLEYLSPFLEALDLEIGDLV